MKKMSVGVLKKKKIKVDSEIAITPKYLLKKKDKKIIWFGGLMKLVQELPLQPVVLDDQNGPKKENLGTVGIQLQQSIHSTLVFSSTPTPSSPFPHSYLKPALAWAPCSPSTAASNSSPEGETPELLVVDSYSKFRDSIPSVGDGKDLLFRYRPRF